MTQEMGSAASRSFQGAIEEKEALYKLLGFGFQQMVGGPAFQEGGLGEADCYAIEGYGRMHDRVPQEAVS